MIALELLALFLAPWFGFAADAWPGEGVPVIQSLRSTVRVYRAPVSTSGSRVVRVTPNTPLAWDKSLVRTERPGLLIVKSAGTANVVTLPWRIHQTFDEASTRAQETLGLPMKRGDLVVYLQYASEGACLIGYQGKPYVLERCPQLSFDSMAASELVVRPPDHREPSIAPLLQASTQWWVALLNAKHKRIGWIQVYPSKQLKVTDRTF